MICSTSSSRRRLICHVLSERLPARGAAQERHHKPNTLLSPAFGACSCFGMFRRMRRREPCPAPALTSQGSGGASRRSPRGSPCPAGQADCRIFPSQDRCRPPIAWPSLHISSMHSLPKVLFVDVRSHFVLSPLLQKPGCHVPQSLLHRARLICKALRCSRMAEAAV